MRGERVELVARALALVAVVASAVAAAAPRTSPLKLCDAAADPAVWMQASQGRFVAFDVAWDLPRARVVVVAPLPLDLRRPQMTIDAAKVKSRD
jgi:hypothetical protein